MDDPQSYIVVISASEELAPIAIRHFDSIGAFQVPDSQISPMRSMKGKSFMINLYVDSTEILNKIQSLGFVVDVIKQKDLK